MYYIYVCNIFIYIYLNIHNIPSKPQSKKWTVSNISQILAILQTIRHNVYVPQYFRTRRNKFLAEHCSHFSRQSRVAFSSRSCGLSQVFSELLSTALAVGVDFRGRLRWTYALTTTTGGILKGRRKRNEPNDAKGRERRKPRQG